MDLLHDEQTFVSARGVVQQWMDWERARDANYRFRIRRHEHAIRAEAVERVRDPEYDAKRARVRRAAGVGHATSIESLAWPEPMTIPTEEEWSLMREVASVEVRVPDRSRTITANPRQTRNGPIVVNTPADLDKDCYGPHSRAALALLNPRCFFHGRDALEDRRTETMVLGRVADVVPLRRSIPLSDSRPMGDEMNPTVFQETEEIEIVVDRKHGVILEWRALFEGDVYERHFLTEIAFDVPVDRSAFETSGP
jgi:hypothetical protein